MKGWNALYEVDHAGGHTRHYLVIEPTPPTRVQVGSLDRI